MNVALINGPSHALFVREGRCTQKSSIWATQWPPITLAYLAAVAARDGHNALVYDCPAVAMSVGGLVDSLRRFDPELCVFALSTPSFESDMRTISLVRASVPKTRIAVLGVHATVMDMEILSQCRDVDFALRGEPEETFAELLERLERGGGLAGVAGLSWSDASEPKRNADRPFIDDLDAFPFPAWNAVDLSAYLMPFRRDRFLCLTPLRGCPYRCSFCTAGTYYGHRIRLRSVESVIEEIRHDMKNYGVRDFFMWAETFTIDRDFVLALCRAMRRDAPGIRWTCNSRTDTADAEMLAEMGNAGCWMIGFGIESTCGEILERTGKRPCATDVRATLKAARREGIRTLGHFIIGLPGETKSTAARTIRDALAMDLDFAQFYAAAPFAGSQLYEEARAQGWLRSSDYSALSQSAASLELPDLSARDADRLRKFATRRFYFRPRQILRVMSFAGFGIVRQLIREIIRRWKARQT